MSEPTLHPGAITQGAPPNGRSPEETRWRLLGVNPLHKEVLEDLRWSEEQHAQGAFDAYLGHYVAVVGKETWGVGFDVESLVRENARKAGVIPGRAALFFVDAGE